MPSIASRLTATAAALAAAALLAACGGDSPSDEATAAAPAQGTASAPATSTPAPAAGGALEVRANDFAFDQTSLTAKAGKVTVDLANDGPSPHELVLLKTDAAPDALPLEGGRVAEDDSVGEVEEIETGKSGSHEFDLEPGKYVFVCNLPGHYAGGMRGELTVK